MIKFLLTLLVVVIAMAVRDLLGTALTIYASQGKGRQAGRADGLGDVANMVYTLTGVDGLNKAGFSLEGAIMMLCIGYTSYRTTWWATDKMFKKEK